ncbi:acetyltransferase [Blastomyces dermatitidis ER-3]|uniref:Acetyltransferase n=2 Tax=Ajellomyces dermatitidis TaxID=5039 RepID=F2TV38_AJEDA|nr:acetyltransferase [Blastomyces dermatitidis ER-3]EEQ86879.2 acetyltransferase [Blastomyces dermatitidis ER-3]EGE87101.2 acetyltransferase [Blastomyces dermatitidis ATCC 18188]EQL27803.1 hypothetical protein BDFG_09394 [Blastomyces dermatitidis ATCC 26199]
MYLSRLDIYTTMPPTLTIHDLNSLPQRTLALEILSQINHIERKTFPASEAFDFSDQSLYRRKPNTHILYATAAADGDTARSTSISVSVSSKILKERSPAPTTTTPTPQTQPPAPIIAYALYVRQKSTALLHKVCVAEPFRGQGVGRQLLTYVIEQSLCPQRGGGRGCVAVQLWVDEKRAVARALYAGCGFVEVEGVEDYYGPGRKGLRMVLELGLGMEG